jgi:hypothetical protein
MPIWTKNALSKLLAMSFSTIKAVEWRELLGQASLFEAFVKIEADGRIIGHFLRMNDELEEAARQSVDPLLLRLFEFLMETSWVKSSAWSQGELVLIHGKGAKEMALHRLFENSVEARNQNTLIENMLRARKAKPGPRVQDRRAWRTYLFMIILWPSIEKFRGRPNRELYDWLSPILSWPYPVEGEDPVDVEDQHYKWFEKICLTNLGLHLKPKGRRVRRLKRKTPTK